jgi:hypothetical protein
MINKKRRNAINERLWDHKEEEASKAIARGEVIGPFDNLEEALKALKTAHVGDFSSPGLLTFQIEGDQYLLRRTGPHDIPTMSRNPKRINRSRNWNGSRN